MEPAEEAAHAFLRRGNVSQRTGRCCVILFESQNFGTTLEGMKEGCVCFF